MLMEVRIGRKRIVNKCTGVEREFPEIGGKAVKPSVEGRLGLMTHGVDPGGWWTLGVLHVCVLYFPPQLNSTTQFSAFTSVSHRQNNT